MQVHPKHLQFIDLVASGMAQAVAYEQTYSEKSPSKLTCRSNGSKLARRYAQEIIIRQSERVALVHSLQDAEAKERATNASQRILDVLEVDALICAQMSPDATTMDVIVVAGKPMTVKRPLTPFERQQAAKIYYQRFGHFAPMEANINSKAVIIHVNADI